MNVTQLQSQPAKDAVSATKRWLNLAIFPVSAGAVGAEVVTVATMFVAADHAKAAGFWAGIACAAAALVFQVLTRKRH
jgi:hypothetical protein